MRPDSRPAGVPHQPLTVIRDRGPQSPPGAGEQALGRRAMETQRKSQLLDVGVTPAHHALTVRSVWIVKHRQKLMELMDDTAHKRPANARLKWGKKTSKRTRRGRQYEPD